jgi:hypothetical protein
MAKSAAGDQLGIVRSTAVISLGLVALAGSIAASLYRRMTAPAGSHAAAPPLSKLVMDEWEADLTRLNLPTKSEVEALQHQLAELETQIDQLIQKASQPQAGD